MITPNPKKIELFYIGEKFYSLTNTLMSPIYTTHYERWDWGKVNIALQNHQSVIIKPANWKQRDWAKKQLVKYKKKNER